MIKYIVSPGWKSDGWQEEYVIGICYSLSEALGKAMLYLNEMINGSVDGDKFYAISPIYNMQDSDDGWILWVEEKKHEEEIDAEEAKIVCNNYVRIFRFEDIPSKFDYDKALRRIKL